MRNCCLKFLMSLFGGFALMSCASTPAHPVTEYVKLPVKAEPKFKQVPYSSLSAGTSMVVLWTSLDLLNKLKEDFPALQSEAGYFTFGPEELIVSEDVPYRRIMFSYDDATSNTRHGPCSQRIYMWFDSAGSIAGTYVKPRSCPI
jgi:hypothetical protein